MVYENRRNASLLIHFEPLQHRRPKKPFLSEDLAGNVVSGRREGLTDP